MGTNGNDFKSRKVISMNEKPKRETPEEHERRMKQWGEEHAAAIAAGKAKPTAQLWKELGMTSYPLTYTKQSLVLAKFPKRFACLWVRLKKCWRN